MSRIKNLSLTLRVSQARQSNISGRLNVPRFKKESEGLRSDRERKLVRGSTANKLGSMDLSWSRNIKQVPKENAI